MNISRRRFFRQAGVGALATASLLTFGSPVRASCQRVSGAGSYELGPFDPVKEGGDPVFIVADLGFDETMVFCKITTNFEPLRFPAKKGVIELGAHEFYMDMKSIRITSMEISQGTDGPIAKYAGTLRSETRMRPFNGANMKTMIEEEVLFGCDVIELGPDASIEISKNNFSMTAHFNPRQEHAAIFGETATFAGRITQGNIVVIG